MIIVRSSLVYSSNLLTWVSIVIKNHTTLIWRLGTARTVNGTTHPSNAIRICRCNHCLLMSQSLLAEPSW